MATSYDGDSRAPGVEAVDWWTPEIAVELARRAGIDPVTDKHWEVIDFIITEKRVDKLHAGIVGNPATHMPAMLAGLPAMESLATSMMKKIDQLEIPPIRELLEMLDDAGAELYGCKMAMDMMGIEKEDLVPQIKDVITAMDFFEKAEGAPTIFI
jgi:peroxiredoxin family protein